jgi:DNA-binding beta-propeller fold protein YncE
VSWLLNSEGGKLYKIDRYDATTTELCDLVDPEGGGTIEFSSMTFSRLDHLYGSHSGALYEIELPSCNVIKIGDFGGAITSVNGISPDEGNDLYAIDTSTDSVYRIDPLTAVSTLIGPAGYNIGFGGATWVEGEQRLLAVDAGNNTLNEVNTTTGEYTSLGSLSTALNLVGFEHHPQGGNLYICSSGTAEGLWEVDTTGQMTYIGSIGFACNDLAAPWLQPPLPE